MKGCYDYIAPIYTSQRPDAAQNRAVVLGFGFSAPQPLPPPCACECAAPRPPSSPTSHHTTSLHLPPPPFRTADPKQSHRGSVLGFRPPTPSPASRLRTRGHMTAVVSTNRPTTYHHLSLPPFDTADPKPSGSGSISGFPAPTFPLPRVCECAAPRPCSRTSRSTTAIATYKPPHHHYPPPSTSV